MKLKLLLPPVLALLLVVGWIGKERVTISTLEKESAVLQERLAARAAGAEPDAPSSLPPDKLAKDKEPIDWKKLAAQMAEMGSSGGMGDMRSMIRLQQRLQEMTKEELVAALDEIAALDLPDAARQQLEAMLIGPLGQKDPEFTLIRYLDRLDDDRSMMMWHLSSALKEWAKKDASAATAWFDQQIAAGKFDSKSLDGKSRSRNQFEGVMIATLLSSDPAAAAARLAGVPADQRNDVLQGNFGNTIKDEDQAAFAKLVREGLPEAEQANAIAQQARTMAARGDYAKVTEYLDRIQATPAERAACVQQAAEMKIQMLSHTRKITREDIDTMREWAVAQAPETADKVTGSVLSNATQYYKKLEFSEAAALAVQYRDSSGNDDVLDSFLTEGGAHNHKEEARVLAEKISDPKRRAEILERLK